MEGIVAIAVKGWIGSSFFNDMPHVFIAGPIAVFLGTALTTGKISIRRRPHQKPKWECKSPGPVPFEGQYGYGQGERDISWLDRLFDFW